AGNLFGHRDASYRTSLSRPGESIGRTVSIFSQGEINGKWILLQRCAFLIVSNLLLDLKTRARSLDLKLPRAWPVWIIHTRSTSPADRVAAENARRAAWSLCRSPSATARGRRSSSTSRGPSSRLSDRRCARRSL